MNRSSVRVSLLVLHLAYVGALWVFFRYYIANSYWQTGFTTALLAFLLMATLVFLFSWNRLVRGSTPPGGMGRSWLTFSSGVWVGTTIAVYVVFVILNAAALRWGSWQF
jgi:hypothetical protein